MNRNTWYTIEKGVNGYTVWKNSEDQTNDKGAGGCLGLFSSQYKRDCIAYCKTHHIQYNTSKNTLKIRYN